MSGATRRVDPRSGLFIALLAALMTMTAMTIDINLPAIPATAIALGSSVTAAQLTVSIFFGGFALGQLVWGPAADRFGRRPTMLAGMALYLVTTAACAFAGSLDQLLAARFVQGLAAGSAAVVTRVIIRDLFEGAQMARVLSLATAAFVTAPIVAPTIGAALLTLGSWRLIFAFLAFYGVVLMLLAWRFLPESLERPVPGALAPRRLVDGFADMFGDPASRRPAWATVASMATLTIYLVNAPAVFMEDYAMSERGFALLFASIALAVAGGNVINARAVRRFALSAVLRLGIAGGIVALAVALVTAVAGGGSGWSLVPGLAGYFLCFGLIIANGTTLAMQPHGVRAGAATSALGVTQTLLPALLASGVAALHDGTALPMLAAMLACTLTSFVLIGRSREALPPRAVPGTPRA